MRRALLHLPLIGLLLIWGFFSLVSAGRVPSFRNESTFGWMVVVWIPLGVLLALTQVALWIAWIARHGNPLGGLSGQARRVVLAGLVLVAGSALSLFVIRALQRWGRPG